MSSQLQYCLSDSKIFLKEGNIEKPKEEAIPGRGKAGLSPKGHTGDIPVFVGLGRVRWKKGYSVTSVSK